jgi:hypothetical protein
MAKKKPNPEKLVITDRTLRVENQTYQIKNLTFVENRRVDTPHRFGCGSLIVLIGLVAITAIVLVRFDEIIAVNVPAQYDDMIPLISLALAALLLLFSIFFLVGIFERLTYRPVYELMLETNAGSTALLSSRDRRFIDTLVEIITQIMDDESHAVNYRINVRNRNIERIKGDKVMGDKTAGDIFKGIRNATIINRSVVQDAIKTVKMKSGDDMSAALASVAQIVEESKNAAAGTLFNQFSEELKKSSPDKSILRQYWDGLVSLLPDIAKLTEACAKIATLFL